ncbi:MAG: amidotransferase, partial [Pseudohongiella sp.]
GLGVMQYQLDRHPPFVDSRKSVNLIVSHRDQVLVLPDGAQRLLSNDFCPNAAFYIPGKVLAIQGHPEFSVDYARALLNLRADQLTPEMIARVESSFATPHDGELVGSWICKFLEHTTTK